jgi:transposase
MASITIDIDPPEGVEITAYERCGNGHGFEVSWPWPEQCRCQSCNYEDQARLEQSGKQRVVRHLDVWGQPSFWSYEGVFHRCARCHHRQDLIPPFKRKDTSYTYAFEEHVVRLLIGSTEEDVARRLGISAETVGRIVKYQLQEAKTVDPTRTIVDVGMDEISLKKRHKLYVTVLTDLTDPERPRLLAVKPGRDEAAGQACLKYLTAEQRAQVHSYRVDMGAAFNKACKDGLPNARGVTDRFHVAKLWNDSLDRLRKKITRAHKAKLSRAEQKEFRSLMWEMRRDPLSLTPEDRQKLEKLFAQIPALRTLYSLRVRFKAIFDTASNRQKAALALTDLFIDAMDAFPELDKFVCTYEHWEEEILNYFESGQNSGVVEGINNKARVVTKRAYGIKSADTLWTRLFLDLDRAGEIVVETVESLRSLVRQFRTAFSAACA